MNSIYLKWRVEVRKTKAHKWMKSGIYETRRNARASAEWWREEVGFGNTRVVRHEVKR